MAAYEIARIDENGVIVAVEPCSEADYRTDPVARTVRLEPNHDMRDRLMAYRWDFNANAFIPASNEPFDIAQRDNNELVEGFVEAIESMIEYFDAITETTNEILDITPTNDPLLRTGNINPLGDSDKEKDNGKRKKMEKFKVPERTARTIKQFRREKPKREVRLTDTTNTVTYEVQSREPEEI